MPDTHGPRVMLLTHPADIDGEPAEVVRLCVEQLVRAADELSETLADTAAQVRNAYLTRMLDINPNLTADDLAQHWDVCPERSQCVRAMGAARSLRTLLDGLR